MDDCISLCLDILDTIFQGIFEGNSRFGSTAILRGRRLAYEKKKNEKRADVWTTFLGSAVA